MDLTQSLRLSQDMYNKYLYLLRVTDITKDPNWKRFEYTFPASAKSLNKLIENAKKTSVPRESMIWIRLMDQYVEQHEGILERLQSTFKPLYEAARRFDVWA